MMYSRLRTRKGRWLPLALTLVPVVIVTGGHVAYSSVSPAPPRGTLSSHSATTSPPPFLPTSCAPQLAVTPVASDTPTATAATPTPPLSTPPLLLDQAQLLCTGGLSVRGDPTQTFTVGSGGVLARVDIPLCAPTKNARIDVTVGGGGSSAPASTATLTLPHDYSDCAWYAFTFAQPISAAAGDILRLTVTSPNHRSALWGYEGQGPTPYPRGAASWRGQTVNSFAFQTYMR